MEATRNRNNSGNFDSEEIDFGTEDLSNQSKNEERSDSVKLGLKLTESVLGTSSSTQTADHEINDTTVQGVESEERDKIVNSDNALAANREIEDITTIVREALNEDINLKESKEPRLVQFPLSKVKQIMKFDPEVHIISADAIFLTTRAAELFVQTVIKEAYLHATAARKKTINKRDVESTIESIDTLMFLEGMMNT
ncbi:DNA polymerase epsilon subunit 4 [Sabethes cyaneus]|uniref:DNA polymerase epsilon subunit 4 n=1 Tax=Sabethes cyaneus TaxID=53552 RepID=UPI00237E2C85|nr:DNA polymerase epsilon subunit 4 [Sabethes cyaneus]